MLRDALKSVHEHSLGLPGLCTRSPRMAALRRRAVLAHAGQLRPTWLSRGLATVWLWLATAPAAGHCAPTAVLLPSMPRVVAQPLPLLFASPRTWPCLGCRHRRLAIYGTAAAHVVLGRGCEHVPSGHDGP